MKVAILGGYGPKQSVGAVYRAFQRAGHEVIHWPTFPEFSTGVDNPEDDYDADLLFTFKMGLQNVPPGFIKSLPIKTKIFWSFDDPHWIKYHGKVKDIKQALEHDACLTSCEASVDVYRRLGKQAFFMPPAMDVEYYGVSQATPKHLVSFITTTLYPPRQFPDQLIDRSKMIDRLTKTFGNDFALFGYNNDVEAKPACRGPVVWETSLPQAIHETRMNINSHVCTKDRLYFNERFFQIVSTGQVMFCDRVSGFTDIFGEDDEHFIWYSSLDELVEKLLYYKDRGNDLIATGFRGLDRLGNWTYDAFVRQVLVAAEGGTPRVSFL